MSSSGLILVLLSYFVGAVKCTSSLLLLLFLIYICFFVPCVTFKLRHEVEPGLPPGAAVGISGLDLHFYQEKRRYVSSVHQKEDEGNKNREQVLSLSSL